MKIKQIPEDFRVTEIINLNLIKNKTDYTIWKLTKKGWDSFKIIQTLARILKTKTKFIGYAGNKDKQAITTQYLSFYKISKEEIEKINIKDIILEFIGYAPDRINLGTLKGNEFKLILRDLKKEISLPKEIQLENYFDEQRFGNKANTHLVGKAILKKEFKEACSLLGLEVKNNDFIGAIRTEQRRLLRFYISSFQSYIWNKNLAAILRKEEDHKEIAYEFGNLVFTTTKVKNFKLPLINFDTETDKLLDNLLKEEGITKEDFLIKSMPELISETQEREAFIEVKDIRCTWSKDELNKGKRKVEVCFFLPKGSYATLLTKKIDLLLEA